jgi:hypothetical protein
MNNREALKTMLEEIEERVTDQQLETLIPDLAAGNTVKLVIDMDDQRTIFMHLRIEKAIVV